MLSYAGEKQDEIIDSRKVLGYGIDGTKDTISDAKKMPIRIPTSLEGKENYEVTEVVEDYGHIEDVESQKEYYAQISGSVAPDKSPVKISLGGNIGRKKSVKTSIRGNT